MSPIEQLRMFWSRAPEAGDDVARFRRHKPIYRKAPNSPKARDALAAMFSIVNERRMSAGRRWLNALRGEIGQSPRLDRELIEAALGSGDAALALDLLRKAERDKTGVGAFERQRAVAQSLAAELAAGDSMAGIRHIAICGVSHVGSTAFGLILGSLPGLSFAGETHHLTEVSLRRIGTGSGKISITEIEDTRRWPVACRVHGRQCECFTIDFRRALAASPVGRYAQIARRLGTDTIVTSDKNAPLYWERDPLFRFDQIVLYKPVEQQMRSTLKHAVRLGGAEAVGKMLARADETLASWSVNYLDHLRLLKPRGKRIVLNWDAFVADPARHLRRLGEILDLPLNGDILNHIRVDHSIGGNIGVDFRAVQQSGKLEIRNSSAPELSPELQAKARAHKRAQYVNRLLDREYRRQFG
jgi:hypothetical protein